MISFASHVVVLLPLLALATVFLQAASETAAALGVAMRGRMYALLAFSSALGLVMEGGRDRC